ncbi:MAG TPA: ADP-ribosylglycohydrolase family protein [Halococcus sp.]|nr:ADP-ribosylglycohydrolase family protein [Halococcus sp.]
MWEESSEGSNAGNGSVMRCAPLAIVYTGDNAVRLQRVSRDSSRITHADPRCTHGCALLNLTIVGFLEGCTEPLAVALDELDTDAPTELVEAVEPLTTPGAVSPETLANTGYVVDTLRTALYHALDSDSAEAAIVEAVNEGGDADTIGAVAGAVAGARFGASALPERWIDALVVNEDLRSIAWQLTRR